jgi:tetratricopeptide (TPR) repeat protein
MLVIKNWRCAARFSFVVAGAILLAGCGAPGPRSLLKGEHLIQERRYEEAIEQLQTAATLLPKNPQAWNHLGLAYHGAGQLDQALRAYKNALSLDYNLAPVRYNLGCLALEQNDILGALEHLTSYTTFQPASADGWIKLGNAQLRARRLDQAEKSYKNALEVRPREPDALNGLGNVAYYRRKPQEALACFAAALGENATYAPAVLNSAVIHHSQNNRQQALLQFKQYAALAPASPGVDAITALVEQLEAEIAPSQRVVTASPPAIRTNALPPPPTRLVPTGGPSHVATAPQRGSSPPPIVVAPRTNVVAKPSTVNVARTAPAPNKPAEAVQVTQVDDDFIVKPVQDVNPGSRRPSTTETPVTNVEPPAGTNTDEKPGLIARLNPFNSRPKSAVATNTPVPVAVAPTPPTNTVRVTPPAPSYPRYRYASPARPKSGNRREAERHFSQGVAQRSGVLAQAVSKYQEAAGSDPAYFEAYYNLGLASYDLGKWKQSLSAYEMALALKPESIDTRYNFALALKQAGHPVDAAEELKLILRANPSETRAHLSLGNLYAQQLAQPALARQHYLKVLALEPAHPRGGEIRYWLAGNP